MQFYQKFIQPESYQLQTLKLTSYPARKPSLNESSLPSIDLQVLCQFPGGYVLSKLLLFLRVCAVAANSLFFGGTTSIDSTSFRSCQVKETAWKTVCSQSLFVHDPWFEKRSSDPKLSRNKLLTHPKTKYPLKNADWNTMFLLKWSHFRWQFNFRVVTISYHFNIKCET